MKSFLIKKAKANIDEQQPKDKKFFFEGEFGVVGAFKVGKNMTAQMLGKAHVSFYPVGDQLIFVVVDSKSKTSWSLNPFSKGESNNVPRVNGKGGPESTTHQIYIWNLPIRKSGYTAE
ncbi:hypothetical protein [Pedobacter sp. W3I1]|uniref:hypothetical protein n=1 Tax=Pedobacter sp. W3I1 TaxID=3042291 RepID=UPI0027D840AF|nr:hypothetical protein [Pedobacter sp. W3I1]